MINIQPAPAMFCEYSQLELPKLFSDVELLGLEYFFDIERGSDNVHSTGVS